MTLASLYVNQAGSLTLTSNAFNTTLPPSLRDAWTNRLGSSSPVPLFLKQWVAERTNPDPKLGNLVVGTSNITGFPGSLADTPYDNGFGETRVCFEVRFTTDASGNVASISQVVPVFNGMGGAFSASIFSVTVRRFVLRLTSGMPCNWITPIAYISGAPFSPPGPSYSGAAHLSVINTQLLSGVPTGAALAGQFIDTQFTLNGSGLDISASLAVYVQFTIAYYPLM